MIQYFINCHNITKNYLSSLACKFYFPLKLNCEELFVLNIFAFLVLCYTGNDTRTNTSCGGSLSLRKGETKHFYCDPPIVGRYVSVVVPGDNKVVNMCEVEVYSGRGISNGVTGDYGFI